MLFFGIYWYLFESILSYTGEMFQMPLAAQPSLITKHVIGTFFHSLLFCLRKYSGNENGTYNNF